ncbi:MAG: hypothetical protein HND57_11320 [Planctomycetes bacterium]|nr:hypothetical protein [Planctomycetota bacterium]
MLAILTLFISAAALGQNRATFTKEELLKEALERHDAIAAIDVTFTCDQISGPTEQVMPDGHVAAGAAVYQRQRIVFSEDGFLNENETQGDLSMNDRIANRWVSYNGVVACLYTPGSDPRHPDLAVTSDPPDYANERKLAPELRTYGVEFFDMQLLNPSRPDGTGESDMSLLSLLSAKTAVVRESTEVVDGHECHVVDLLDPSERSNQIAMTVWVDAQRSCLPIRHVHYIRFDDETVEPMAEYQVLAAAEVEPGVWMGTKGYKHVFQTRSLTGIPEREWEIEVDTDESRSLLLAVNHKVDPGMYELWDRVPPGTSCVMIDTQEQWIAKADDIESIAAEFLATLLLKGDREDHGLFDRAAGQSFLVSMSGPGTQPGMTWSAMMTCSIAGAAFLLLPRGGKRKSAAHRAGVMSGTPSTS